MVECPRCGAAAKTTDKRWKYSRFDVERYNCQECDRTFNVYYTNGKYSHTVPKSKKNPKSL